MHDDNVKVVKWLDNRQCMHRGIEYPIVLSEDLLSGMKSIVTVASNASSTDGFGYYSGWLHRCLASISHVMRGSGVGTMGSHLLMQCLSLRHYLVNKYA